MRVVAVLLLIVLPLMFVLPPEYSNFLLLFALALGPIALLLSLLRRRQEPLAPTPPPLPPRPLHYEDEPETLRQSMEVHEAAEQDGIQVYRGRLLAPAHTVFQRLRAELRGRATPLLQPARDGDAAVILMPKELEEAQAERPIRPWLHWLLFVLTLITTTLVGAANQGVNLLREPERFAVGLPFSLTLMAILGCHELGHYFTARRWGMKVTPPFFIPVPFGLGTFGAFIQMRSPAENRRALFDVAVAGPLAGLVIALPALYFGLRASQVVPASGEGILGIGQMQTSLLFSWLAKATLGVTASGEMVQLHPAAEAGVWGLFVTALNLLPIGQLDGGHIARSMLGTRWGMVISQLAMWGLLAVAFLYRPDLMMFAMLAFFLGSRATPPLNDLTPITPARVLLGVVAFVLLVTLLLPAPGRPEVMTAWAGLFSL